MREVQAVPLSVAAFAPYGSVVSAGLRAGQSANQGTAVRFDFCAPLTSSRPQARGNLAVFRSTKKTLPFEVKLLEKHPCSTQAFLPMVCARFLVCVAPARADGTPDDDALLAFVCGPGQGISYDVGVWHHPIIALDDDADFAMVAFEDGSPLDCVEHPLAHSVVVIAPGSSVAAHRRE
ncbi:MAG: ureidoglycolate lyase [Deltaproteobacteria bacterium]|nr:ureidoglycolate lyase [Deltaproteobacteria bacterium]